MSQYVYGFGRAGGRGGGGGGGGGGRPAAPRPAAPRPAARPRGGRRRHGGGGHRPGRSWSWPVPPVAWGYPYPTYTETVIVIDDPFVQKCEAAGGAYANGICWLRDGSTRTREQGLSTALLALAGLLLL